MARLSVLPKEKLTPEFSEMVEKAEETGHGTVFQVLGHRADMFQSYFKFYYSTHEGGVVKPAIKELARLRIAQLNNCFTWKKARFASVMHDGLTEEKIAQIDAYQDSDAFTAQEKLALRFAEKMALSHHEIGDEFFRELRAEFSDAEVLELGMMIGQYIGLGRLLMVLDVERPVCSLE